MKKKYRNYSRIAVALAIIASIIITKKVNEISEAGILISFFGSFVSLTNILFLIINFKKDKAIDKKFGFLKVKDDRWLGYDGFWHDGYKEIFKKKIDQYYEKGGDDFGYIISSRITWFLSLLSCFAVIFVISRTYTSWTEEAIFGAIVGIGTTVYFIIRRAVFG